MKLEKAKVDFTRPQYRGKWAPFVEAVAKAERDWYVIPPELASKNPRGCATYAFAGRGLQIATKKLKDGRFAVRIKE